LLGQRWGEYLAAAATSIFLPLEIYDLTGKVTWLRVAALVINLLLVIYLVWAKPLFGARGGKTAYEARLRSVSVIEVEQAALTAASPGPATEPAQAHPTRTSTSQTPEEDREKLHA
jgi:hypothetical protein